MYINERCVKTSLEQSINATVTLKTKFEHKSAVMCHVKAIKKVEAVD